MSDIRVHVAAGEGLVSRRADAILFIPEPNESAEALLQSFESAAACEALNVVGSTVVALGFGVCAFALVVVEHGVVQLRVFGDLELTSSLPTAPMLSGRGSGTWVDHSAAVCDHGMVACGSAVDERTDLRSGTVAAGGVAVVLGGSKPATETFDLAASAVSSSSEVSKPDSAIAPEPPTLAPAHAAALVPDLVPFTLMFDNGLRVPVGGPLVLGRKPLVEDVRERSVPVDGDRVSRTHLRVEVVDGELYITDLGSRNGSAVVWAETGTPEPLPDGRPVSVAANDRVVMGSAAFVVTSTGDSDV